MFNETEGKVISYQDGLQHFTLCWHT